MNRFIVIFGIHQKQNGTCILYEYCLFVINLDSHLCVSKMRRVNYCCRMVWRAQMDGRIKRSNGSNGRWWVGMRRQLAIGKSSGPSQVGRWAGRPLDSQAKWLDDGCIGAVIHHTQCDSRVREWEMAKAHSAVAIVTQSVILFFCFSLFIVQ